MEAFHSTSALYEDDDQLCMRDSRSPNSWPGLMNI